MKQKALPDLLWLLLLLLVVCLPRVTIDAYLPALPAMADSLHGTDAQLQLTLTLYMAGYALSMLISGPLSDRCGRRPVLIGGLLVYVAATVACALATSVTTLLIARIFQALGGCTGTVVGRVIVRERFDTASQSAMLSRISAGMALSPVIAPLAGSFITDAAGWRGVFAVLALGGIAAMLMVFRHLPETRTTDTAHPLERGLFATYAWLLRDRSFLRYSLSISFVYCTYFPFIAESSTLFQRGMHLSGPAYAAVFGITVLGYILGSSVFRRANTRWQTDAVITSAVVVNLSGAGALWAANAAGAPSAWSIVLPMFVVMVSVGIAIPACQFAVLQPFSTIAGTASGLFFFIQMAITALCGGLLAHFSDATAAPMIAMTAIASIGFAVSFGMLRPPRHAVAAAG